MKYLITFHTHFDAIQYVKFLKKRDITGKLQPVPRRVSSSCGTCATFSCEDSISCPQFFLDGCEEIFTLDGDEPRLLYSEKPR